MTSFSTNLDPSLFQPSAGATIVDDGDLPSAPPSDATQPSAPASDGAPSGMPEPSDSPKS